MSDNLKLSAPELGVMESLRGMSEPLAFAFNLNKKCPGGPMLVHAVIFSSYEVADNDRKITLCSPEDDPRMGPFINFCIDNYAKKAKTQLQEHILIASRQLDDLKRELNALNKQINKAKHHV